MGIAWLAGGMFMLYVALRRWRIDPAAAMIAPLLLPTFPRVLHASTTVNPDAVAPCWRGPSRVACGQDLRSRTTPDWVLPAVLTGLAGMTKIISWCRSSRIARARRWREPCATCGSGASDARTSRYRSPWAARSWCRTCCGRRIRRAGATRTGTNPLVGLNTRDVAGLPGSEWLETAFSGINLASEYYLQPPLDVAFMVAWTRLLNVLVIGAVFAVIVACAKEPARRSLGWLVMAGVFIYPTVVQVQAYLHTRRCRSTSPTHGPLRAGADPRRHRVHLCIAAWKAGYRRIVYFFAVGGARGRWPWSSPKASAADVLGE